MQSTEGTALFAAAVLACLFKRRGPARDAAAENHGEWEQSPAEECVEVREVLAFWFDGDTAKNYKYKWFPSSNKDIQERADRAIADRFVSVLQLAAADQLGHWGNSIKAILAKIIVLDQFSRHIYRSLPTDAPERAAADKRALALAERLVASPRWQEALSTPEFVFALMPFRHSSTLARLEAVLQFIAQRSSAGAQGKDEELLSKFHKQTTRRYQALQDRARAEAAGDIVLHHHFEADETDILRDPLVATVLGFLLKHLAPPRASRGAIPLAISLSGGVDSMVIAKILAVLRDRGQIRLSARGQAGALPVDIVAMHIDYGNRPESGDEARFVQRYATDTLRLQWRLRHISEVTRGVTERSDYEKISRNIRYSFYKEVLKEMGCQGVIFGHHIGDVQENVISNVMRGSSSLYLSGMTEVGVTEGVAVWRPLLAHDKDDIYRFAHKYGVPYLQDTTPSWSTRGKLRNVLVPLLMDIYGTGCLRNLSSLAADSDAMRGLVQSTVFDPFMQSISRHSCGVSVEIAEKYRDQSAVFWAEALKQIMHSMGMSLVREKAVQNFVGRIHMPAKDVEAAAGAAVGSGRHVSFETDGPKAGAGRIMSGWVELRKGFNCYIDENSTLCILRQGVLRPSGSAARLSRGRRTDRAEDGSAPPCVEVLVSGDCAVGSIVVVSSGSNGVQLELPALPAEGDDEAPVKLLCSSELSSPLQSSLLDVHVCLTALTALNLAYPLSPTVGSSLEAQAPKQSVSFSLDVGAWTIVIRLTPSAQSSFQISAGPAGVCTPGRAASPEALVFSDGEQSDLEDGGVWKWSPGERSERRLSCPPPPEPERLPPLTDIHDVLNGKFSYEFPVYHHNCIPVTKEHNSSASPDRLGSIAAIIPLQLNAGMTAAGVRDLNMSSLRALETKIREGLPLVAPVNVLEDSDSADGAKKKRKINLKEIQAADLLCTVCVSYFSKHHTNEDGID